MYPINIGWRRARMINAIPAPSAISRLISVKTLECITIYFYKQNHYAYSTIEFVMKELFHRIATRVSNVTGTPGAFLLAFSVIIVWAITGPAFGFSDTWQLVINTGTTIVTFLMVFLIQNTQNRDAKAMQLKLDELIRATRAARDDFVGLEEVSDDELRALEGQFKQLRESQPDSVFMKKLRKTIESENERRKYRSISRQAVRAAGQVVNLLDPRQTKDQDGSGAAKS